MSKYDPLPKAICLPCDAKLEQHHRFIQRVIQNQKKIQGNRSIILEPLRVRVREDENNSNTYNVEAISSDSSLSSTSEDSSSEDENTITTSNAINTQSNTIINPNDNNQQPAVNRNSPSSSSSSSSSSSTSITDDDNNDENEPGLVGFNSSLEPVNLEYETNPNDEYGEYLDDDDDLMNDQ